MLFWRRIRYVTVKFQTQITQLKSQSNDIFTGAGPECFYPSGTDTSDMALAAQNMDGTSNEIDYQDIFFPPSPFRHSTF